MYSFRRKVGSAEVLFLPDSPVQTWKIPSYFPEAPESLCTSSIRSSIGNDTKPYSAETLRICFQPDILLRNRHVNLRKRWCNKSFCTIYRNNYYRCPCCTAGIWCLTFGMNFWIFSLSVTEHKLPMVAGYMHSVPAFPPSESPSVFRVHTTGSVYHIHFIDLNWCYSYTNHPILLPSMTCKILALFTWPTSLSKLCWFPADLLFPRSFSTAILVGLHTTYPFHSHSAPIFSLTSRQLTPLAVIFYTTPPQH